MESGKSEFSNIITMDDENIEKFKKLYGEGRRLTPPDSSFDERELSFSQIIPEPAEDDSDKNWVDNSLQDKMPDPVVGRELEIWRYDNWGTSSDLLYDSNMPNVQSLEGLLKGEYAFFTMCRPPIKVYEKMAADGLVFETTWGSDADDEWTIGKGQVVDGLFQYHIGPMTGSEKMSLQCVTNNFLDSEESLNDQPTIVVKDREHLDQLLEELQENIKTALYMQGNFSLIGGIVGNTVVLNNVLDLNFLDVSNVTDLSNLFANFDISPHPEDGWFCKIKLDISKWNVSNATKTALLHDNKRVDLVNMSK
ncbi:hypothetical protein [Fibrobacter sp.]|uniref:hypothetical protein n=1 Tax=Fibrobacter sp. TaxID=35828 RepID=UPI00388D7E05